MKILVAAVGEKGQEKVSDGSTPSPPQHAPKDGDAFLVEALVPAQADPVLSLAVLGALVVVSLKLHQGGHDVLVVVTVVVLQKHCLLEKRKGEPKPPQKQTNPPYFPRFRVRIRIETKRQKLRFFCEEKQTKEFRDSG